MIVGISTMQVPGAPRPSHEPSSSSSSEGKNLPQSEEAGTPYQYSSTQTPVVVPPQGPYAAVVGMTPQQMYVGHNGGQYPAADMAVLASQLQAMAVAPQPPQGQPQPPSETNETPQSGDSETGDDNDGTAETEEEPVKLFVGQVSRCCHPSSIASHMLLLVCVSLHLCHCSCRVKFRIHVGVVIPSSSSNIIIVM